MNPTQFDNDRHHLSILKDLAEALNEATDVSQAMEAILPRLSEVLGLSTAWAFRYDPKQCSFVEMGASGLPPALACNNASPLKTGWCECQDQFIEGKLRTAVNIVRCSRLRDGVGDNAGLTHHASIPLRSKGKPLGILNVAAAGHRVFTETALQLLTTIGHHVAVAVDRASILSDERHRSNQLNAMSEIAVELVGFVQPLAVLQYTVTKFVETLGYESCGVTVGNAANSAKPTVVAAAHRLIQHPPSEYSYMSDEEVPLLPDAERVLLTQTRSVLSHPIPNTEYTIRIESCQPNAFRDIDDDLLSAFTWHISAALENAHLYEQSMEHAKWAERRQLAADLHDAVSQRLFSAMLLTRTAKTLSQQLEASSDLSNIVDKVESLIAESQQEMRDLIQALRPSDERGFITRLREKIAPLQLQSRTRIHLSAESADDLPVTFEQRETLLKVIDEALQNTFKHANARNVYLRVTNTSHQLLVTIRDDGCGFDVDQAAQGLGTTTMYERMASIGGALRITSVLGKGSRVICELPLPL